MNFEDLKNPELQEKLKSAKSAEDLVAIAKAEGLELTDEQLEAISGGDTLWADMHPDDCSNFDYKICLAY